MRTQQRVVTTILLLLKTQQKLQLVKKVEKAQKVERARKVEKEPQKAKPPQPNLPKQLSQLRLPSQRLKLPKVTKVVL